MMEEEEQNRYVAQLKEEFDSCDTTGTGYLDREELTALCHKLHLDAHLPLLLGTLLGPHNYARVNFEEFKEGFVAVLSRSLDLSTSEEESSYLEPVVPEEVKPKFVKGTKRYGRRSRPDRPGSEPTADSEEAPPRREDQTELFPAGVSRAKLRRSTSLESVESLKSDEEPGSNKETTQLTFEAQGQLKRWKQDDTGSPRHALGPSLADEAEEELRGVWEELGVGISGFLSRQELSLVCESIGLQDLCSEELDLLFRKLDKDQDGRVSLGEFQRGFCRHGSLPSPTSSSTPIRSRPQHPLSQAFEDSSVRSASPSLLSATVGQRLLSRLDDGSGCTSPEQVMALWSEEGIRNSKEILQTLDFSLDERLSLAELTLALDNELLVSGNGIHQAALVSYKNEIQFLHVHAEQASRERDKAKADLELAERRNLQLVSEVDDRHTTMETLNESKIKALELEYRGRLTALRSESEQDSEVLLQQVARERAQLQEEVEALRTQQASHQEEVRAANHENRRLEKEVSLLKGKLSVSETTISRLQKDLDHILLEKFGSLDPDHTGLLSHEERFSEIIKEYELQCRALRDRNDELSSELEMLKNQAAGTPFRRVRDCTWSSRQALATESDSDYPDTRKPVPNLPRKRLQVSDKNGLGSLDSDPVNVSIETELALEQLKEKHSQEVQDLKIQLETKVNFYERSLELMRHNMEVERKDISQGFKMEISELEEQKAQTEEKAERLRQSVAELRANLQSGAWGPEQERRRQREQAELEQNYAREIANLVQRLTSEKDQLEMELKLKMDQEVQLVREEAEQQLSQMELQYSEAQHALQHQLYRECSWQREQEGWVAREVQQECVKQEDGVTLLSSPEAFIQPLVTSLCAEEEEPVSLNTGKYGPSSRRGQLGTAKEDELSLVRHKLKEVQEVLKNREDDLLLKAAELKSLEDDKARLMKELENQGAKCEQLQVQIDDQEQHLDRGRKAEQGFSDALGQEENKVPVWTQSILDSERQERNGLIQEKAKFTLLCDQLSTPTVEMEADSVKLMEDIGKLRLQLKQKDNMILKLLETEAKNKDQLRFQVGDIGRDLLEQKKELYEDQQSKCLRLTQLEVKVEEELCVLAGKRENSTSIIQQALKDAQAQVQRVEEEFELEKGKMKEQLLEMERLVMALEPMMDQASPHRVQLDEVTSENTALKDRVSMLQTDVQRLEEDVNRKKKRMEELEKDHGENREELERLYKEKAQRREETLGLSARNLQLSEENSDLRARLQAEQSAGQLLRDRLERLSQELEEQAAEARRLQETSGRQERELAQLQGGWQRERLLLDKELKVAKEKLQRLSEVETELASLILKHQWLEQDKQRLLKEAEEKAQKGEKLLESLSSLSTEMEQLRSQVQAASLDRSLHAQELAANQRMLQDTTTKVREMEASLEKLRWEKEQLRVAQQLREDGETQALRCQNQELLHQVSRLQVQEAEVQRVTQECLILKTKQAHLENELLEAQDQCLKTEAALAQAHARHSREIQKVREEASAGPREQLGQLQARLAEEQRRGKQLEEHLHSQARQASTQMTLQQEHYEKVMRDTEEKMEEVERKLKNLRMLLQEKVNQLKEQLSKNTTVDLLLKDLYVENSQLMKALQVTEQRQKTAEKNNFLLQEKIVALNMLLRKIAPAALST